jgi:hypothetical protein
VGASVPTVFLKFTAGYPCQAKTAAQPNEIDPTKAVFAAGRTD